MGIHDSGEIIRKNWKAGVVAASSLRELPTSKPNGTPISNARNSPTKIRLRLTAMFRYSSLRPSNSHRLARVADSENRADKPSALPNTFTPNHQSNNNPASPLKPSNQPGNAKVLPLFKRQSPRFVRSL